MVQQNFERSLILVIHQACVVSVLLQWKMIVFVPIAGVNDTLSCTIPCALHILWVLTELSPQVVTTQVESGDRRK